MNVNLLTLFAPPVSPNGSPAVVPGFQPQSASSTLGDVIFGKFLSAQLQTVRSNGTVARLGTIGTQLGNLAGKLSDKIAQLLASGQTAEQIVASLAQSLGDDLVSKIQAKLGVDLGAEAKNAILAALQAALTPPANGPPLTTAERAAALAQRFGQVAGAVARVTEDDQGQQQQRVGTILDAEQAKDNPAPSTSNNPIDSAVNAALALLATPSVLASTSGTPAAVANNGSSSASNASASLPQSAIHLVQDPGGLAPQNQAAVATSPVVQAATDRIVQNAGLAPTSLATAASDGRRVIANPTLAIQSTGGDTPLGRILARAANAQANAASVRNSVTATADAAVTPLQSALATAAAATVSGNSTSNALIASVLRNLQSSLEALPVSSSDDAPASADGSLTPTPSAAVNSLFSSAAVSSSIFMPTPGAVTQKQTTVPTSYVDPNSIVDQVLKGVFMRSTGDSQTMRMRLVPEHLGDITVNLEVQGSQVSATLVAQNADVRDTLLANQAMLLRSMQDAGLKLTSFTVDVSGGQTQSRQSQSNTPRFGTTRRSNAVDTFADEDHLAAVPTFGPSQSSIAAMQWLNALA